jgi:hypothetical protein
VSYRWPLVAAKQFAQYVMSLELLEEIEAEDDATAASPTIGG